MSGRVRLVGARQTDGQTVGRSRACLPPLHYHHRHEHDNLKGCDDYHVENVFFMPKACPGHGLVVGVG